MRDAAFGCDWVGTALPFQRCLMFIIATANKEFQLTAGKFVPVSNFTTKNVCVLGIYVQLYVRMYVYMYVRAFVCMYVCMYVRLYVRTFVCIYVCMCVCVCIMYVCMYVCLHTFETSTRT